MNHSKTLITLLSTLFLISSSYAKQDSENSDEERDYSKSASWGYGIAASFCVSSTGFLMSGMLILILKSKRFSEKGVDMIITVLIAFAIGALLGNVVVHLLPQIFGYTQAGDDAENSDDAPKTSIVSLMIFGGFIAFIFIERFFESLGMEHSHKPGEIDNHTHGEEAKEEVKAIEDDMKTETDKKKEEAVESQDKEKQPEAGVTEKKMTLFETLFSFKGRDRSGLMVLIVDFQHNIMDGLGVGVAFASGKKDLAISTFVAIVAHELPEELGNMGILLGSKFPRAQAMLCNGAINFSSMLGTIIGLAIGSVSDAINAYILAFVAGNFFYVSLVVMLPVISAEKRPKQSFGLLVAFIVGAGSQFALLALN